MGISYKSNVKLPDITKEVEKVFSGIIADELDVMLERVQTGKDVNNGTFKPYSESYKKYKAKYRRQGVNIVDLELTGAMKRAIKWKVERKGNNLVGTIYLLADQVNKAKWNQEIRKWFGFTKEQFTRIGRKVKNAINKK